MSQSLRERATGAGAGEPSPEGSSRWDLLLLLLLGVHLVWLFSHFLPIAVGPDAGGIFVQARLLATELATGFRSESPLQFLGSHWMETPDGDFHSRYPPGFPLLLAVAYSLGGPGAPFYLNPILATSVVGLTYLVSRRWLGRGMAFWAALMVAALPILNRLALHGDAHVAAASLLLLGIWLLFRWEDRPSPARAVLAGLAFGLLPSIRYPETVVGAAVLAFFLFEFKVVGFRKGLVPGALGASLPLFLLAVYNGLTYGAPWRTGYGFTNEQSAFHLRNLTANLPTYLGALTGGGVGIVFFLGLAGMVWMCLAEESRRRGILLLLSVASLTFLYAAYYWGAQEEAELTLRYFLATLPLYVLGAAWLVGKLPHRRATTVVFGSLSLLYLVLALPASSRSLLEEWVGMARGAAVAEAVSAAVPPGSVLVGRREVQDMLDYFGRWRLVDDRMLPGTPGRSEATLVWELTPEERATLSDLPTPVQITKAVEARARYVGLSDRELATLVLEDMRAWAGEDSGLYWIGKPQTVGDFGALVPEKVRILHLGDVSLPGWGGTTLLPAWVPKAPMALFRLDLIQSGS